MNTRSVQRTMLASAGFKMGVLSNVQDCGMRIGSEYQAIVPEYSDVETDSSGPGSLLLWKPSELITESELDGYLRMAKERYGYSSDQALGMLYYHNYDITKAVTDLANFCPLKEEWSIEDKVIFEQAFRFHNKNFHKIKLMLPDKPISTLVKYYYLWKRAFSQYSLMDKQALKNSKRMSSGLPPTNDDNDSTHSGSNRSQGDGSPHILPPVQLVGKGKQLPKGIYMSTSELSILSSDGAGDCIKGLDADLSALKIEIQTGKQELNDLKSKISDSEEFIESLRPCTVSQKTTAIPTKWAEEEIKIAVDVIRKQGKNVDALARALPSKSVPQCRNFFTNYKRKLNLPRIIAEFELKNGQKLSRYSRQGVELLGDSYSETVFTGGSHQSYHDTVHDDNSSLGTDDGDETASNTNKRPRIDYSFM